MPRIKYLDKHFSETQLDVIVKANRVVHEYVSLGYAMTLRGLYYVFVGRKLFPEDWRYRRTGPDKWVRDPNGTSNATPNYKALGKILSDARMAGLVDWLALEDTTRGSHGNHHWEKPSSIIDDTISNYMTDKWKEQKHHVEVWVEKAALLQIISTVCVPNDVRYFACRGYGSAPALWDASQRLLEKRKAGKELHILYLGDHDPSGLDIPRDVKDKLSLFLGEPVHVQRVALNMKQVEAFDLPPDPAKSTDPRFKDYQSKFGDESWELDALDARVIADRTGRAIAQFRDDKLWDQAVEHEKKGLRTLTALKNNFTRVVEFLRDLEATNNP